MPQPIELLAPLIDGEERNRNHPETFHIPPEALRHALSEGTYAKVGVEGRETPPFQQGEKFWTRIAEVRPGPLYIAEVDNDLVHTDYHGVLRF
jgi:hypothetical protein